MNFNQFSQSCVKCSKCIPTCTVHQIERDEINSPRGFLDLLAAYKEGNLELDKEVKRVFEFCFLCTSCVEVCPSHIRVNNAIEAVCYDIAKKFGIAWYKRPLLYFLRKRKALDLVAKFGLVFQSCAFALQDSGMKARFSLPLIKRGKLLLSFKQKSSLNQNTEFIDNDGGKNVGFFADCLANYFYIDSAKTVLSIAKELKINVDLMKEQVCCGVPRFFTGDFKSLESLAKKNVEYFEKKLKNLDYIITPEATRSVMLSVDLERFFTMMKEEQWAKRVTKIAPKIKLVTWYFHEKTLLLELLKIKGKKDLLLTYHGPCHIRKTQGVFKKPRALLRVNYRFIEMNDSNTCCGFGGVSVQSGYYEDTLKVGLNKAKMIDESGASVVSAECSAYRMRISNALTQNQSKAVFKSPFELVAQALKQ